MTAPLLVAVAEDHVVFRRELVVALERDPAVEVVAEAADLGRLAPRLTSPPAVVVVDASDPGGDLVRALVRFLAASTAPVVVMVGPDDDPGPALLAGAAGVVSKADLVTVGAGPLRDVAGGLSLLGAEGARALLGLAREHPVALSARQQELLQQLAAGRAVGAVAGWLGSHRGDTSELIGATIGQIRAAVPGHPFRVERPAPIPPVDLDPE